MYYPIIGIHLYSILPLPWLMFLKIQLMNCPWIVWKGIKICANAVAVALQLKFIYVLMSISRLLLTAEYNVFQKGRQGDSEKKWRKN